MVEKDERGHSTGEVSRERWYLLTSLGSQAVGTQGTAQVVPQPLER